MANFPGSLSTIPTATAAQTLALAAGIGHTALHNLIAGEILAVQTKVGTGASTPTSGKVLRGMGAGTSAWGAVDLTTDVTGILPVGSGGTGQANLTGLTLPSATLANPTVTGTVAGSATYTTPTLTTPTIASFTNAVHNHQNNAGGGTLAAAAMPALSLATQTLANPYKFSVFQTGATNTGNGAFAIIAFDSEQFDTSSNVSAGTFTAPVAGFYEFSWGIQATTTGAQTVIASLFVNSVEVKRGSRGIGTSVVLGSVGSTLVQLAAGDTVAVGAFAESARPLDVAGLAATNYFTGYFVINT